MSSSRLRICACTDTSSAETGSSQMISFGSVIDRARDRDALALAAGELVRAAVARGLGVEPDRVEHLVDLGPCATRRRRCPRCRGPRRRCRRPCGAGSATRSGPGRSSACAGGSGAASSPCSSVSSVPSKRTLPDVGRRELHDRPAGRRLAAARLADEPERLARDEVEADPRHRVHLAALGVELDDEVLDAQQRRRPRAAGARCRCRPSAPPRAELDGAGCARAPRRLRACRPGTSSGTGGRAWSPATQRRLLLAAPVLHVRAAVGEAAAGGRRRRGRVGGRGSPTSRVWLGSAIFGIERSSASV